MSLSFSLKTHRPGMEYSGVHFFILNRGLNSGKPLLEPCPNCFVVLCENEQQKEQLYWIFFALWQGHYFRFELIGSVIPFIRKKELLDLVRSAIAKTENQPAVFSQSVTMLQNINQKDLFYRDVAQKLQKLKIALVRDLVR